MSGHFHSLKIREVRRETPSTVSLSFDIPNELRDKFKYEAGQYLTFKYNVGGEELRRSYSLCSAPEEGEWRVAVKEVPDGRFSSLVNNNFSAGMDIETMEPMGNFTISDRSGHHVGMVAGSGITPVMSIVKSILTSNSDSKFTLFYGNKKYEEIIFREELERLVERFQGRLVVHHILSQEQRPGYGFGRLDRPRVDSEAQQGLNLGAVSSYYLCGPAEMIFSLKDHLIHSGVNEDRICFELFTAPVAEETQDTSTAAAAPSQDSGTLVNTYILDGERFEVEVKNPDMTILDIGLAHGIDLPFACQGGVCCTCRAKVQSGKVDMRQNFSLGDGEVNDGYVLTCQSYPQGENATLDYDA